MHGGRWTIGDVTVTRIAEMETTGGMRFLLPQATREAIREIEWLQPHFADEDGRIKTSIHALVIEVPARGDVPGRRIVVDTCLGNDKTRANPHWTNLQTDFLKDLEGAGFAPQTIDTVLCTHLHVDHVGWNTMLVEGKWVPTFPNARYLMAKPEYDHWSSDDDPEQRQIMADSVEPVFEAGLVDLVETTAVICDEIRLVPTLGHTPGHVSIKIESQGESALITGDFVHHPCQMAHPDWAAQVDTDPVQSTQTRREVFADLAGAPTLIIGTHFASPSAGYLKADGDVWRLEVE